VDVVDMVPVVVDVVVVAVAVAVAEAEQLLIKKEVVVPKF
jgi:hypothetical protein